jgi:Tfp pilus assembly protein PilO
MTARLRRPAVIGALVCLVFTLGWWQLLWNPQGAALAAAHKKDQQESANLVTVEQSLGHLKHLQVISPKLAALEARLTSAAPMGDELDQVLLAVNGLVQSTGITVQSVSVAQPSASTTGLETMELHLGGQGDYFAVQDFLDGLRNLPRLVVADALSETPNHSAKAGGSDQVTFTLAAHLFTGLTPPPPAAVKAAAAPTPTTKAPTGIISGPVTKAKNAVSAANANTARVNNQANSIGGP